MLLGLYVSVYVYHGLLVWFTPLRVLSFTVLPVSLFPVYQSFVSEKCVMVNEMVIWFVSRQPDRRILDDS